MKKSLKIIGIILVVLALIVSVGIAILYNNGLSGMHNHSEPIEGQIKVACVGDSITYGHGISDWKKNNYPAKLGEILGDGYHVANFGESGRTLSPEGDQPYTESEQYRLSLEYCPDILIFMLGTNDSKPENWKNEETFLRYLNEMLDSYREVNPNVKIYICTPAKAFFPEGKSEGLTNFDIQPLVVDHISNCIRGYAVNHLLEIETLIDIHYLTSGHPEWFEADNVHPDKNGALAIAELIAKKILK